MSLISLVITITLVGVALWAINALIPMQPHIKTILNVVVVIVLVLWLIDVFGLIDAGPTFGRRVR